MQNTTSTIKTQSFTKCCCAKNYWFIRDYTICLFNNLKKVNYVPRQIKTLLMADRTDTVIYIVCKHTTVGQTWNKHYVDIKYAHKQRRLLNSWRNNHTMYGWNVDDEKPLPVKTTSLTGLTSTLAKAQYITAERNTKSTESRQYVPLFPNLHI